MNISRIVEFKAWHRLVVWYDGLADGWLWRVSRYENGSWWLLGESRRPASMDQALARARTEISVWAQDVEPA